MSATGDLHPAYSWFTKSSALSGHARVHPIGHDSIGSPRRLTNLSFFCPTLDHLRVTTGSLHLSATLYHLFPRELQSSLIHRLSLRLQRPPFSLCSTLSIFFRFCAFVCPAGGTTRCHRFSMVVTAEEQAFFSLVHTLSRSYSTLQ